MAEKTSSHGGREKLNDDSKNYLNSEDELEEKKKEKENYYAANLPYYKLFRYADYWDITLVIVGSLAALIHGAGLPVLFIVFGNLTSQFTFFGRFLLCDFNYTTCFDMNLTTANETQWVQEILPLINSFQDDAVQCVLYFVYVACAVFCLASTQVTCWYLQAIRQSKRIRVAYFHSILRQDIGFHDVTSAGELNARLTDDIAKIKNGMGEKVSTMIQYIGMTLAGLIVGLVYAWKLALVSMSVAPLLGVSSGLIFTVTSKYTKRELAAYGRAGSVAEEAISAIRTVTAFGCQSKEVDRYISNLADAKAIGVKKGFYGGVSFGVLYLTMFGMYGLSFWYGTTLVIAGEIAVGDMMTSFFGILLGAFGLGTAMSYTESFSGAKAAAGQIYEVIDRVPAIDVFSTEGKKPNGDKSNVELKDVHFEYPSRPDIKILQGVNLTVEHGKTVALVGQSGCGKSTIMQLIQRFYDVQRGSVEVGGADVKSLRVSKLRELIGVVAQEPVLFATTIGENIKWGREGVSQGEVVEAAKKANAFDFINKLPMKFDTLVGEGGGQMSGGQKQRIAIARAIVRNPKLLLLDEATSALDTESESIVQSALEKASAGRTTIVIAHRLSTIRNADKIVAFHEGRVMEQGSHADLLNIQGGVYSNLVNMQSGRESDDVIVDERAVVVAEKPDGSTRQAAFKHSVENFGQTLSSSSIGLRMKIKGSSTSQVGPLEGEELDKDLPEVSFGDIFALNKPEWIYMLVGGIFAGIAGTGDPINAILFTDLLTIFTLSDPVEQNSQATTYGLLFFALGVVAFVAYIVESTMFGKSGVELTVRLRGMAIKSMLRQDIGYFDDHCNSTGALCTRLSTDASRVQGCTGVRVGTIVKNFSSLGISLTIAFIYGWKLTLLTMAFIPFIIIGGAIEMELLMGEEETEKKGYENAGQISGEAIHNIKTIASLTKEKAIYDKYVKEVEGPIRDAQRKSAFVGLGYGYSQCVIYFAYAAVFRLGIELVISRDMSFENVFKVLTVVIFGAMAVAQNSSFAPDYAEAKVSAARMFKLFNRKPTIDAYSDEGHKPDHCKGEVTLKSVFFHYPSRPDMPVLKGLDVSVKPGQTLALVGQSGCGKSTSVQLLERFYDPEKGGVEIDGCDIKKLNLGWVRQQIGLVSQEPVLFDQSIKENIAYGDISRQPSDSEIVEAAKSANIHSFIQSLPKGYNTNVGPKGGQLSGGQKQRIAIARSLIRNPKILLLDEATSALDTESEKIVQEALDSARRGRTSIVIAHRLSTVRNADVIAVIDNGAVVEVGKHDALIAKKGAYYSLVNAQLSDKDRNRKDI